MPVTATAVGALLALLTTVTVPLALPAALGLNATFIAKLCPGIR
jgi:hypothetical protein